MAMEGVRKSLEVINPKNDVKVMIGGTVITDKYAERLNVGYAKHASDAVDLAHGYMGGRYYDGDDISTETHDDFNGKEPDRVPVSGVANDWAWGQLYGEDSFMEYCMDPERSAEVIVWGCREMGSDAAMITADTLILWEAIADASGISPYSSIKWKDFIPTHPHGLYSCDPIKEPSYGDPLVKTIEDANKLRPADPYKHGRLPFILKAAELAMEELGEEYPLGGMADIPMHVGECLMGWTQMFIAMEKDLALWKTVEDVIIKSIWNWIKAQYKIGIRGFFSVSELPHKVGAEEYFKHPVWMQADHPPEIFKRAWEELKIPIGLHSCTSGPFEPGIPVWKTYLDHCFFFMMPECGGSDVPAFPLLYENLEKAFSKYPKGI